MHFIYYVKATFFIEAVLLRTQRDIPESRLDRLCLKYIHQFLGNALPSVADFTGHKATYQAFRIFPPSQDGRYHIAVFMCVHQSFTVSLNPFFSILISVGRNTPKMLPRDAVAKIQNLFQLRFRLNK